MNTNGKKSTLQFDFGENAPMPTAREAVSFFKTELKFKENEVHSIYRDPDASVLFVKFKDDHFLDFALRQIGDHVVFTFQDGRKMNVAVSIADGVLKYVRLFNLPPETTDSEIVKALTKYGTVRQVVREKFPADFGFNVFSGIRGAHIEVKNEIPATMFVGHCKARVFYDGLKNRCFLCKLEGHVKADCPNRNADQPQTKNAPGSYAKAVKGDGGKSTNLETMDDDDSDDVLADDEDDASDRGSRDGDAEMDVTKSPERADSEQQLSEKISEIIRGISPTPEATKQKRPETEEGGTSSRRSRSWTRNSRTQLRNSRQALSSQVIEPLLVIAESDRDPKRSRSRQRVKPKSK